MKTTLFKIDSSKVKNNKTPNGKRENEWRIEVPLLSAYSVEHLSVLSGSSISDGRIENNKVIIDSDYEFNEKSHTVSVILHYHGFRDYSALFPWVKDEKLQNTLGTYYEEAEKCFDEGAWLSFALMCGAVFEGMLYAILDKPSDNYFANMINVSRSRKLITAQQKVILKNVKENRNLVHLNRFDDKEKNLTYITRTEAMDIRTTLDQMIKDFNEKSLERSQAVLTPIN